MWKILQKKSFELFLDFFPFLGDTLNLGIANEQARTAKAPVALWPLQEKVDG